MRKLFLFAVVAAFALTNLNAQESQFGVTAGYFGVNAKVKSGGESVTASDSGFYIGGVVDFGISDVFHIQPELLYANVNDSSALILPIMAKYYVSEGFNLQAGPQVDFSLEDMPDDISAVAVALAVGAGYDINENFFAQARYSFQLTNSYTGPGDLKLTGSYLTIGLGYKF